MTGDMRSVFDVKMYLYNILNFFNRLQKVMCTSAQQMVIPAQVVIVPMLFFDGRS